MAYIQVIVTCDSHLAEMLIAELGEAGFDTFMETTGGFEAYVEEYRFDESIVKGIIDRYIDQAAITYSVEKIEKRNWNEEWEKSYEPIIVANRCLIRAHFHKPKKHYPFEIIITPKMSFGTGHHQTTYLMIQNQMDINHQDKIVMDAGCGTAILSVMASKLRAKEVEAFDIDEWSVINGTENIEMNQCNNINIRQGKVRDLSFNKSFDIVLANINKNILLEEIPLYANLLKDDGKLLMSGFYGSDVEDLVERARASGLIKLTSSYKESWAALLMMKRPANPT
ncbi:MAG TPA: 50S ribosomal protein L11 methyltransferase [Cyclobacteriaceae bacterium]|nr:50S ribosomal protein L11 methyltransferase [Cyclobacteriaceae bacterium]